MRSARLFLLSAFFAGPVFSASLEEVLARLEQTEKEMTTLKFDFQQSVRLLVTKQSKETSGSAAFKRPDRFRVELKGDQPQRFISDGTTLWVYMPDRKQAMKQSMEGWARGAGFLEGLTPFRMTVQEMRSRYTFVVENPGAATPVLRLKLKDAEAEYSMRLWVDMSAGLPTKTELLSPSATVVTNISNAQVNPLIGKTAFQFSPPAGTDVLAMPFGEK